MLRYLVTDADGGYNMVITAAVSAVRKVVAVVGVDKHWQWYKGSSSRVR